MNLDAYTLAVVSALAAFFMAVTMGGIYLAGNRERAIAYWAFSGLFLSIGHLLGNLALSGAEWVKPTFAVALGNTSVMVGYGLILLGIQQHLRRPLWTLPLVVVVAFVLIAGLWWPAMYSDTVFRVSMLTAIYLVLSLAASVFLWRADEEPLRPYRRAVAAVIMVNVMLLLLRTLYIASVGESGEPTPHSETVMVPVFLSSTLFYMALNVALALMLFRRKEVHLRHLARHDALTGLLNRYSLDEYAARELARAGRGDVPLSLVVLDLDDFKRINDMHGHAAGDRVLVETARRIEGAVRGGDIAFRVGGEEFLVMLPGADVAEAMRIAERLRRTLDAGQQGFHEDGVGVSASVGVVTFDPVHDDWERLLRRADQALYRAKLRGRNRVESDARDGVLGDAV